MPPWGSRRKGTVVVASYQWSSGDEHAPSSFRSPAVIGSAAALALPQLASAEPAAPAPAAGITVDQVADRVQSFYDRTKTFKSRVQQRYWVKAYNKTKDSAGDVIFEKPGKMSWRYTNNGNRVVSDGKIIKVYEKENKQMYEQPLEKSQYPAALAFLTGGGSLEAVVQVRARRSEADGLGGRLRARRRAARSDARLPEDLHVRRRRHLPGAPRVLMLDAQGNRNRFDFERARGEHQGARERVLVHPAARHAGHPSLKSAFRGIRVSAGPPIPPGGP